MKDENRNQPDANRDPITGKPGSHPVGTGVGAAVGGVGGAAAGAAIGAAAGTAGAGPIGTGIGAAAGAIIGGAVGHESAEGLNPTTSQDEGRYIGYEVIDRNNEKLGNVHSVWLDHENEPAYLAIKTGWLGMGHTYVVPTQRAEVSERKQQIRIPYTVDQIKGAPQFQADAQLQSQDEERIGTYYKTHGFQTEGWLQRGREAIGAEAKRSESGNQKVQLKEEHLKIGKRDVEYGGVRLRKVVRSEVVNQPVELKREEIVIERVPATGAKPGGDFSEEEIYVPLRREEAVVGKETEVTEEVRIGKKEQREKQTISETVRKEDVEIEEQGGVSGSRITGKSDRNRPTPYQPKERSR